MSTKAIELLQIIIADAEACNIEPDSMRGEAILNIRKHARAALSDLQAQGEKTYTKQEVEAPNLKPRAWWSNDHGWMINDQYGFPRQATEQEVMAAEVEGRTYTKQEVEAMFKDILGHAVLLGGSSKEADHVHEEDIKEIARKHGLNTDTHG